MNVDTPICLLIKALTQKQFLAAVLHMQEYSLFGVCQEIIEV